MAAALLAPGPDHDHQPARHPRRGRDGAAPRGARLPRSRPTTRRSGSRSTCPRSSATTRRTGWCAGSGRASACWARSSRAAGEAEVSLPGRGQHRLSRARHAHPRAAGPGRDGRDRARLRRGRPCPDCLRGAELSLEFPSVGATENLLMAATLADGTTVIDNAAREPEIGDLCAMLLAMGADIEGVGSQHAGGRAASRRCARSTHATVADRIVAGTWAFAAAIAGGDLTVEGGVAAHLDIVLDKLVDGRGAGRRQRPRVPGPGGPAAGLVRRRHAAVPRLPDGPAAVRDGARPRSARGPR